VLLQTPYFQLIVEQHLGLLGVNLILIAPVKLPAIIFCVPSCRIVPSLSYLCTPMVHFFPSGALGFAGATQSGWLSADLFSLGTTVYPYYFFTHIISFLLSSTIVEHYLIVIHEFQQHQLSVCMLVNCF
jgi:hypothetical protein